jgi:hypothetical protein
VTLSWHSPRNMRNIKVLRVSERKNFPRCMAGENGKGSLYVPEWVWVRENIQKYLISISTQNKATWAEENFPSSSLRSNNVQHEHGRRIVDIHIQCEGRMRNDLLWMKIEKIEKKIFACILRISLWAWVSEFCEKADNFCTWKLLIIFNIILHNADELWLPK